MSAQDVLDAVRDVIVLTPGMVTGYAGIPEKAPTDDKLPAGMAYQDFERDGAIAYESGIEEWTYPVQVDLLLKRVGDFLQEVPAAMALGEAFLAEMRKHTTLWGAGFLHNQSTYQLRQINHFNETYVAFRWKAEFGEQFEVSGELEP